MVWLFVVITSCNIIKWEFKRKKEIDRNVSDNIILSVQPLTLTFSCIVLYCTVFGLVSSVRINLSSGEAMLSTLLTNILPLDQRFYLLRPYCRRFALRIHLYFKLPGLLFNSNDKVSNLCVLCVSVYLRKVSFFLWIIAWNYFKLKSKNF